MLSPKIPDDLTLTIINGGTITKEEITNLTANLP